LDFLLPGLCWLFAAAERRESAVASGAGRILCFLIGGTIYFGVNFNRLWQLGTRKLPYRVRSIFFREQLALQSALNIGARVVSPIRHQN
jgi:hypothetical protein